MLRLRQLFAIVVIAGVLVVTPLHARPSSPPLGIVTSAQRSLVGQVAALDGTSLYDGDTVATESVGAMRLRFGGSQMVLGGDTMVTLNKSAAGVSATLVHGTVRFASVPGSILELHTLKVVVVRAKGDKPATGQLSVVGPNEFSVGSTKGDLVVSVNGNEREVNESTAYRVTVEDADAGAAPGIGTLAAGRSAGLWIAIAAVAAGTTVALILAFMSPSKP